MKIVVFAYHDIGRIALKTLLEMNQDVVAVFTHQDDSAENVWFGSVAKLAQDSGIPVFTPEDVNTTDWIKKIKSFEPDLILSFYYRKMICDCILAIAPRGSYNLHGSLLPKYRGRAPINWAIIKGEKETGITLHKMVKKPDAGDIAAQKKVEITLQDTAQSVFQKLLPKVKELLLETIPQIQNQTLFLTPQDHSLASYFGGRKAQDGEIDWTQSALEVYNLVRGVTHPYPGSFTFWGGKKVFIWKASLTSLQSSKAAGLIMLQDGLQVVCGFGILQIERLQTEGQVELSAQDWLMQNEWFL